MKLININERLEGELEAANIEIQQVKLELEKALEEKEKYVKLRVICSNMMQAVDSKYYEFEERKFNQYKGAVENFYKL